MKTIRFKAEIAVNAGYDAMKNGQIALGLREMGLLLQKTQEETEKETGILVPAVVSGPNLTCYPEVYGCPSGGEVSYTVYSLADYRQKTDGHSWSTTDWQKAVLFLMNLLREKLEQDDVNVEFIDNTGVDSYVISKKITLSDCIRELEEGKNSDL